ncbi:CDP-2,3-bis-(O-geranylgeranyl)-sn-glycerol synthase [Candidatus Woesearchaeota archaeon]|nr:CDP-2,3-bis-(O-geranylgeranyl)-sn-glycerol synthase [Candidatus Woesearchaeota archaeon]
MQPIILKLLSALYFMLPAYVANMAPVIVKRINIFNVPLDQGRKWKDGKPVFGSHKTWRGLIAAVVFGAAVFALQQRLYVYDFWRSISLVNYPAQPAMLGVFLGLGAILGDLVKSFFKRRRYITSGKPWIPFDQLDFVVGALLLSSLYYIPQLWVYVVLLVISPLLHILVNHIAFYLRIRKEKW